MNGSEIPPQFENIFKLRHLRENLHISTPTCIDPYTATALGRLLW
jgi:hypothetical protein